MRLRLTALRISSTDISTITALRRAMTPYTPMQNSTAPSSRKLTDQHDVPSPCLGQDDGADDGGGEQR